MGAGAAEAGMLDPLELGQLVEALDMAAGN